MAKSFIEKTIANTFMEIAQGLETGSFGKRPKIALTGMGSEHGEENAMAAAVMAAQEGIDVYYIGSLEHEGVITVKVADDEEGHKKMEEMLANKRSGWQLSPCTTRSPSVFPPWAVWSHRARAKRCSLPPPPVLLPLTASKA